MFDLLFIAIAAGFFAGSIALAYAFDRMADGVAGRR